MEIIKKKNSSCMFRVLKPFKWGGYVTEPGQELAMSGAEALGMIQRGKVTPTDIPEVGEYIALQDLTLPGDKEAHRAKKMERILLKKDQALDLMLKRLIVPVDTSRWTPYGLHLQTPDEALSERKKTDELVQERWRQSNWEMGILQEDKTKSKQEQTDPLKVHFKKTTQIKIDGKPTIFKPGDEYEFCNPEVVEEILKSKAGTLKI